MLKFGDKIHFQAMDKDGNPVLWRGTIWGVRWTHRGGHNFYFYDLQFPNGIIKEVHESKVLPLSAVELLAELIDG